MISKYEIAYEETSGIFDEREINITGLANAMDEYAKESAIEFFKWNRNNYSSQPNEEELEERYELFIKSIEEK